ncbi:MAG: ribosome maturation factor RimP [Bryobacteraceae bacterium]|jgi:ribosome maturation factor RimP
MNRNEAIAKIEQLAERVVPGELEIVEVELKGSGRNQLVRIVIDKPEGVTHADCEAVSHGMSALLDAADVIPASYQLEVSSPGVERKLRRWRDWERFQGRKAKVVLKQPLAGDPQHGALKHFEGVISRAAIDPGGRHTIAVELADGRQVAFPLEEVDRANLKFDW